MRYRRFGRTELQIPVISCGGMRFQQSFRHDEPVTPESQQNVESCVHRALELGINHIETARGYGTSEEQLGRFLPSLDRDAMIIQTKVGPSADPAQFRETLETSFKMLRLEHVDLLAFHGVNNHELLDQALQCMPVAREYQRDGRVRHIGFSTHGSTACITDAVNTGEFDYVNLHWYFIFQDNLPAIEAARRQDMGVFIISPNDKGGLLQDPTPKLCELTQPYHPMVFNGLFCLANPDVHTLSCGVAKPGDFDPHIETADLSDRAADIALPIAEHLDNALRETLGQNWADTWQEGLPEWDETPGEINIPWILRLRNLALAFDMVEYGKMRYGLLGNGGHWFAGKNAAELESNDLSACLARSPHRDVIPGLLKEAREMLSGVERKRLQEEDAEV
jgi:uncharacterized protein